MERIDFERTTLPILYTCDVVVVGGSLGGVAAALRLARAGRKVVLVEPRTYLGREVSAALRPWIRIPPGLELSELPEVVAVCIEASGTSPTGGEVPLHMDIVKLCLEDLLVQEGVKLLYASLPVELCSERGELQGVVVGNKSGRQVLICRALVDTSETAVVARLARAGFETASKGLARFSCTLEFDAVAPLDDSLLPVSQHLDIVGDRVVAHAGYRERGHVLIECELSLPSPALSAIDLSQRSIEARRRTMDLAAYLLSQVPAFRDANLTAMSHDLFGSFSSRMAGPLPKWVRPIASLTVDAGRRDGHIVEAPVSCFAGSVVGLWCLNESARLDASLRELVRDPVSASSMGTSLACVLDQHWEAAAAPAWAASEREPPVATRRSDPKIRLKEPKAPQRGRNYEQYSLKSQALRVLGDVDVLVVGGGTSGAVAAITAAREGMRTLLVEMNPGLGGTGTYGGVASYWFGRRIGFAAQSMAWVDGVHDDLGYPRLEGPVPRWNIEAKIGALLQRTGDAGVELMLNTLIIGAIVEGNDVLGVLAATPMGPVALLAKVVIDATGDGDVAAFAGAEFTYGAIRDHAVMWYSLAQFAEPGCTRNNFTSMVDVANVEDYTRAILAGRRRGKIGQDHDHGIYVAPRESRHIRGDVVITLTDQLLQRCWHDVVNIAFSNNDIKGQSDSDWMRMGLISPNLEIEIPYGALLPKGLENILVVGKALSATHNALPAVRMQPDLENLGGVAGLAAAMAVRQRKTPRGIDVRALQTRLVQVGALPEGILERELVCLQYTNEELEALIDSISADHPLHAYSDMDMSEIFRERIPLVDVCCAGPQAVPRLQTALQRADGCRRVLLAQALAILGAPAAVPVLVSAIQDQLSRGQLPGRESHIRHAVRHAPDQAAMPDLAYLIYSLGMARDFRALRVWQQVVEMLASTTEDDVCDQTKGVFYYVDAVCFGAERLGDQAAIPLLRRLHSYSPFHGREYVSGFQPDHLKERQAYLELVIGRALARCGSLDGVIILINYLNDVRGLLAEHAHSELVAITGRDLGKDMAAWSQWLEIEGEALEPTPWLEPLDPMVAWGETILVRALDERVGMQS